MTSNQKIERIHGSRDYFSINFYSPSVRISFEIIPVLKIRNPEQAENVTDTSPFHVEYIKGKIRKDERLADEIRLVKAFCHASECYGAESHIRGFSGYSLELLTSHYSSFINLIKSASRWNLKEKIIIDPEKSYRKGEVLKNLNKSKTQSPIILIDPTQKERNATASLSEECLHVFVEACRRFTKNPSKSFFIKKERIFNIGKLKDYARRKKAGLFAFKVQSNKKREDIAGSKLLKFFNFLSREFSKDFSVLKSDFIFNEEQKNAVFLFILSEKKEIFAKGPPVRLERHAEKFRRKHKDFFVKNGMLYSRRKARKISNIINLADFDNLGIKKIEKIS